MPIDVTRLPLFVMSALVLLVVPGPAVLFAVSRSLEEGRRAGIISVVGLCSGATVHVACSVLGVSALLEASEVAFHVLRLTGAAYLVYLGVRRLTSRPAAGEAADARKPRLGRAFVDGFVVNLFNPKAALFLLAFLPQFVDPARGAVELQLLTFGGIFLLLAFLSDGTYALAAGSLAAPLRRRRRVTARVERYGAGSVYVGLGIAAALSGSRGR